MSHSNKFKSKINKNKIKILNQRNSNKIIKNNFKIKLLKVYLSMTGLLTNIPDFLLLPRIFEKGEEAKLIY